VDVGVLAGIGEELAAGIEGRHGCWVDPENDGRWRYAMSISWYSFCCASRFAEMAVAL
jgi:hypothetical protein